jgi:N-methylhydantoinase A
LRVSKTPSTPRDQSEGILAGIAQLGIETPELQRIVHGTTVATNTALERDGAHLAVLVTAGHKDVLVVGRGNRMAMYNIKAPPPRLLVPRSQCVEIDERMRADGSVAKSLDEAQVDAIAQRLAAEKVEAVAICFLHAYANPDHERRCAARVKERLPAITVTTSSEVLPEFREYERFSTTALNAYVAPRMRRYLSMLRNKLSAAGCSAPLAIMTSNGGSLPATRVEALPALSMLSGPAAGVIAASRIGSAAGYPDVITCDMGGTSSDVCLVRGGEYAMTTEGKVGGLPLKIRQIDINSIGVGGGSIAAKNSGVLSVGPRSAGALPGPACYARGGAEATITDANVVLGRLGIDRALGGKITLDPNAAGVATEKLALELGLSAIPTAEGILRLATVSLAGAIKEVSVMRGIDPRDFALIAFGGAGPLHAAATADELGMATVVIPPMPGNFSALGLLLADVRRDLVRTRVSATANLLISDIHASLQALVREGEAELAEFPETRRRYSASLDMRYVGQSFELSVPVSLGLESVAAVERAFNDVYAARYGAATDRPIEIVSYRLAAFGISDKPALPPIDASGRTLASARTGTRRAIFGGIEHQVQTIDRGRLPVGDAVHGPALIDELSSTTVVPPGWNAVLDRIGCLVMHRA